MGNTNVQRAVIGFPPSGYCCFRFSINPKISEYYLIIKAFANEIKKNIKKFVCFIRIIYFSKLK